MIITGVIALLETSENPATITQDYKEFRSLSKFLRIINLFKIKID
jgi:hypothetical protein